MRAVIATPALQAVAVPLCVTGEVAEDVVAGLAEGGAGGAIVVFVAHGAVGVTELTLVAEVLVLGPVLSHGEPAARGQSTDKVVLVLWMNERKSGEFHHEICDLVCLDFYKHTFGGALGIFCVVKQGRCRRLAVKQRGSNSLPADSGPEDSAFQASMIREKVPWNG